MNFKEKEGRHEEDTLMPVIIQRFAELGAVIESQKRHIDRWKVESDAKEDRVLRLMLPCCGHRAKNWTWLSKRLSRI